MDLQPDFGRLAQYKVDGFSDFIRTLSGSKKRIKRIKQFMNVCNLYYMYIYATNLHVYAQSFVKHVILLMPRDDFFNK